MSASAEERASLEAGYRQRLKAMDEKLHALRAQEAKALQLQV